MKARAPLTRRAVLGTAPALLALPASSFAAEPDAPILTETPILRLFHAWQAEMDFLNGPAGRLLTQEASEAHMVATVHRLEEAIKAEPATDLRDLAAKIVVLSGEGTWALPEDVIFECSRLAGRSLDRLPRSLFEQESA